MNPRRVLLCFVAVIVVALALSATASAGPGDLDATFGTGGKVVSDFDAESDQAQEVDIQPDGKIVVAVGSSSRFGVARYHANGSLDTSFSVDGLATADFGVGGEFALAIALQGDGKMVVSGNASPDGFCCQFALARFNSDGTLDATFDGDGMLLTNFGGFATAIDVVVQPDGRIVAAGSVFSPSGSTFALARYTPDGSLDATFDGDGKLTTPFTGGSGAGAVVLQPDGKIVAAGTGGNDFAVARYHVDGSLDTTFDGDGKQTTDFALPGDFATFDSIHDVALQTDGKIVAAGVGRQRFALARYNPDGSLDSSFDGDGKASTQFFGENREAALGVALQGDGKIIAAGAAIASFGSKFALARYNADGSLDTSFGGGGLVTTDFGEASDDGANDVAVQANGRIVAVGGGGPCIPMCLTVLARYEGDASDTAPPVITVPASLAVDATGPAGAVVMYTASATDDVDGSVPVHCFPPPGSTFAIGTTSVRCTSEDAAGNDASAGFDVHVKGATEQLDDLLARVLGLGPGTSLHDMLVEAHAALGAGEDTAACEKLNAFTNAAQAQSGKKLTPAQADELVAGANRIRAVLDC